MARGTKTRRCPGCGKPVYERSRTFCTMRCKDAHERQTRVLIEREVGVLMRQYDEGAWAPVSLGEAGSEPPERRRKRKKSPRRSLEIPQ